MSQPLDVKARVAEIQSKNLKFKNTDQSKVLAEIRHPNRDFFACDLVGYAIKDDVATMEAPLFSLSTKRDKQLFSWTSVDGTKSVDVAPGFYGRATQHDKDIIIFCVSQLVAAINNGIKPSCTVRFTAYDFLVATNRRTDGDAYEGLKDALNRLKGTQITTNIATAKTRTAKGFGIIDSWEVIEKSPHSSKMVAVEVTLSQWLYNAIQAKEVLTIDSDYFRLRKPLERRLYEIARKHVGYQKGWIIGLEALRDKCGSTQGRLDHFKKCLEGVMISDALPEYRLRLAQSEIGTTLVTFRSK